MPTIAILAEKGGVGKTTTAAHLSAPLASKGESVLLVDADPQSNLADWIGPPLLDGDGGRRFADGRPAVSIYDVLLDPYSDISRAIAPSRITGVDMIPGARGLGQGDRLLSTTASGKPRDPNNVMLTALAQTTARYTVRIIDSPPSVGLIQGNAIACADLIIVPIEPGEFAFQGLAKLGETITELLNEHIIDNPPAIGALLTKVKSRRKSNTLYRKAAEEALAGYSRGHVFESQVRYAEIMQTIPGTPGLTAYGVKGNPGATGVANDYAQVADELIAFAQRLASVS